MEFREDIQLDVSGLAINDSRESNGMVEEEKFVVDSKRANYLSWSDYFMSVACLSAQRSKDPHTQVGACIVNAENKIVGIGYNGMPNGCSDDLFPWSKRAHSKLDTKFPYVCHAEMNAVLNSNFGNLKGCTIYVVLFPCNDCAKIIIQAGIKKVVYMRDKPHKPEMIASKRLFDHCNLEYKKYVPTAKRIVIDLASDSEANCTIDILPIPETDSK